MSHQGMIDSLVQMRRFCGHARVDSSSIDITFNFHSREALTLFVDGLKKELDGILLQNREPNSRPHGIDWENPFLLLGFRISVKVSA